MRGKDILTIMASLVAGILLGNHQGVSPWFALAPVILSCLLFLFSLWKTRSNPFASTPLLNYGLIILLFFGLGIFTSAISRPASTSFETANYAFSGKVLDYTPTGRGDRILVELSELQKVSPDGSRVPLEVINVKAFVTVTDPSDAGYGKLIRGYGKFRPIDAPGNYLNNEYCRVQKNRNIFLSGFASEEECQFTSGFSISAFFQKLRYDLEARTESTHLSPGARNFIISLLLGDKSYIREEDRVTFTDAGIAHIFAVSGFHVSMVSIFILGILSLIFVGGLRRWKFLACLPLVWTYILLVGASPATCRAGIMITIAMTALFLERKNNAAKSLGWTVIIILLLNPRALFDVGFQLSVVCVGSLILIAQPLNFVRHREHPKLYKLVSLVLVSLIATFSAWAITAYYFHKFSLVFLPMNIIVVPLLPFFLILSTIYLLLSFTGIQFSFLAFTIDKAYELFHKACSWLTELSMPVSDLHPRLFTILLWVLGLSLLAFSLSRPKLKRTVWMPAACFGLSVLSLLFLPSATLPSGFIIQRNNSAYTIMHYSNGRETEVILPESEGSVSYINGKKVLKINTDDPGANTLAAISGSDIIILGRGCKSIPEAVRTGIPESCLLMTHPTLHWRHERNIIQEAKDNNIPVHSLRYDGPYHLFED